MPPLVPLADALTYLGVAVGGPDEVKVSRSLDAISAEVRRITRRGFEGVATVYDEVLRVAEAAVFVLPRAPVAEVLSVRETYFDGTEEAVLDPRVVTGGPSTSLALAALAGATNLRLTSVTGVIVGRKLAVGSGTSAEVVRILTVGTAGAGGTGANIEPPLRYAQALAAPVFEVSGSILWLLEMPRRGRVRLNRRMEYGRFAYQVSGEVPADVVQHSLTWLKIDWETKVDEPVDTPALASQSSEDWSESYIADEQTSITRRPPPDVARMLAAYWHPSGPAGPPT